MRSDVVFETKCPASILNEHMGCLSACRLSLTVSRTRQIREDARSRAAGLCVPCGRASKQSPGIKAVLGAPAGSGHIRTVSMPYSTKLPLPGWLWTEMPFAHWKHRPNSSTEVSPLSPPSFYFIPCHHGQPTPCVTWGMWWCAPEQSWADKGRHLPLTVLFWEQDKEWDKHVTVN